jgi:hypothetical protein
MQMDGRSIDSNSKSIVERQQDNSLIQQGPGKTRQEQP